MQEEKKNNHKIKEYSAKMVSPVLSFINLILWYIHLKHNTHIIYIHTYVPYMSTNTPIYEY